MYDEAMLVVNNYSHHPIAVTYRELGDSTITVVGRVGPHGSKFFDGLPAKRWLVLTAVADSTVIARRTVGLSANRVLEVWNVGLPLLPHATGYWRFGRDQPAIQLMPRGRKREN